MQHVHAAEGLAGAGDLRGARLNAARVAGAGLGIQIGHGPEFRFASGFGDHCLGNALRRSRRRNEPGAQTVCSKVAFDAASASRIISSARSCFDSAIAIPS